MDTKYFRDQIDVTHYQNVIRTSGHKKDLALSKIDMIFSTQQRYSFDHQFDL